MAVDVHALAPRFAIEGHAVIMDVFNLATLSRDQLGPLITSLSDDESRSKLIRALDELVAPG